MSTPNPNRVPRGVRTGGQFAAETKTEPAVTLAGAAADPFGGYRLTKIRRMVGREGPAYSGVLTRDGRPVADVIQDGNGGPTLIRFRAGQRSEDAEHFTKLAQDLAGRTYEPDGVLVDRLATVEELNRKKAVVFVLDGDDPFSEGDDFNRWGTYHQFKQGLGRDAAARHLTQPQFEGKNPKVWVPERAAFVPVSEMVEEAA